MITRMNSTKRNFQEKKVLLRINLVKQLYSKECLLIIRLHPQNIAFLCCRILVWSKWDIGQKISVQGIGIFSSIFWTHLSFFSWNPLGVLSNRARDEISSKVQPKTQLLRLVKRLVMGRTMFEVRCSIVRRQK